MVYEVYKRVYGMVENVDIFDLIKLLDIDEPLYCFDLVQFARGEVLRHRSKK